MEIKHVNTIRITFFNTTYVVP